MDRRDREDILQDLNRQVAMDVMRLELDRGMDYGAVLPRGHLFGGDLTIRTV